MKNGDSCIEVVPGTVFLPSALWLHSEHGFGSDVPLESLDIEHLIELQQLGEDLRHELLSKLNTLTSAIESRINALMTPHLLVEVA